MSLAALAPRIAAANGAAVAQAQSDAASAALSQLAAVSDLIASLAAANPVKPIAGVYRDPLHALTSIASVLAKLSGEVAANTTQHVTGGIAGAIGEGIPQIGLRGAVVARKPRVFKPSTYRIVA
jgi:hypothetical protein